jgi:hypothetical protein
MLECKLGLVGHIELYDHLVGTSCFIKGFWDKRKTEQTGLERKDYPMLDSGLDGWSGRVRHYGVAEGAVSGGRNELDVQEIRSGPM